MRRTRPRSTTGTPRRRRAWTDARTSPARRTSSGRRRGPRSRDSHLTTTLSAPVQDAPRKRGVLHRHPRLRLGLLLTPPLAWLGVLYLSSLAVLFVTAFWTTNSFTTQIEHVWNLDNFRQLWNLDVYRTISLRTLWIAVAVTVVDALIAFPIAFFMAKVASRRWQRV